jgi:hypothetical protein
MKALFTTLVAALLLASVAAPTLAARTASCSVSPTSAPAGSTFTVSCEDFQPHDNVIVSWIVEDDSGTTFLFYTNRVVTADGSGSFTDSQVIPVPGNGHVGRARLCQGHCQQNVGPTPYFIVTP